MNEENIRKHFRALKHKSETEVRFINHEANLPILQVHVNNENEFVEVVTKNVDKYNCYVGINERCKGGSKNEHIIGLSYILLDIDAFKESDAIKREKCITFIESRLIAFGLKYSYKIMTGNGYHYYIPLTKEQINDTNKINVIVQKCKFLFPNVAYHIDDIYDSARVMRIWGTHNKKVEKTSNYDYEVNVCEEIELTDEDIVNNYESIENTVIEKKKDDKKTNTIKSPTKCPLMDFILNNEILKESIGKNKTLFKNAAIWAFNQPNGRELAREIANKQHKTPDKIFGWYEKVKNGDIDTFNCDELAIWMGTFDLRFQGVDCYNCVNRLNGENIPDVCDDDLTEHIVNKMKDDGIIIRTIRDDTKNEFWIYMDGIWKPNGKSYIEQYCRRELLKKYDEKYTVKVANKIKADEGVMVEKEEFFTDENKNKLCLLNGILDINTKELLEYSPKYKFFNKLPLRYDPTKSCEKIDTFFNSIVGPKDTKKLYQVFGWCLYRKYQPQQFMIFQGNGGNGKGVTLRLLHKFLGDNNCTNLSPQSMQSSPFLKVGLWNKMANLCGEMPQDKDLQSEFLKAITGEDTITVDRKFLSAVTFVSYAKIIINANTLPEITDNSVAFWRRFAYIKFPYSFKSKAEMSMLTPEEFMTGLHKEEILGLVDTLVDEEELSGLLNKSIESLKELLDAGSFNSITNVEEKQKIWLNNANNFSEFISEHLILDANSYITRNDVKTEYIAFCSKHKLSIVNDKRIFKAFNDTGAWIHKNKLLLADGGRMDCWMGIKFKDKEKEHLNCGGQSQRYSPIQDDFLGM